MVQKAVKKGKNPQLPQSKIVIFVAIVAVALLAGVVATKILMSSAKTAVAPSGSESGASASPAGHDHHAMIQSSEPVTTIDLTAQKSVSIDIKEYAFAQKDIKVKKGTVVTWTNRDVVEHNVMAAHDHSEEAHGAPTKDEVDPEEFAGPLLAQGESYSFTFDSVGTFAYHCAPHPSMQGSVTVVE